MRNWVSKTEAIDYRKESVFGFLRKNVEKSFGCHVRERERERERDPLAKEDLGAPLKSCGLCNWILDLLL